MTVFGNEAFEHVIKLRRLQGVRVGPLSEVGILDTAQREKAR